MIEGSAAGLQLALSRTSSNVRYSVAVGCKADIEQAASKMLDLRVHGSSSMSALHLPLIKKFLQRRSK
jgi:hypothetical protein